MPSFTPSSLNTPETVYTLTASATASVQIYVNTSPLQSGDTLNIKVASDVTGVMEAMVNSSRTVNSVDPLDYTAHFSQNAGDTITLTLEQTAGTLRSIDWQVVVTGN